MEVEKNMICKAKQPRVSHSVAHVNIAKRRFTQVLIATSCDLGRINMKKRELMHVLWREIASHVVRYNNSLHMTCFACT